MATLKHINREIILIIPKHKEKENLRPKNKFYINFNHIEGKWKTKKVGKDTKAIQLDIRRYGVMGTKESITIPLILKLKNKGDQQLKPKVPKDACL